MSFFVVTMTHPDGDGWGAHVAAHVRYLEELVRAGSLRASGPLKGTPKRSGFLIFSAAGRDEIDRLVSNDPFAVEGMIDSLSVAEWDPLFGTFAAESSGELPGLGAAAEPRDVFARTSSPPCNPLTPPAAT